MRHGTRLQRAQVKQQQLQKNKLVRQKYRVVRHKKVPPPQLKVNLKVQNPLPPVPPALDRDVVKKPKPKQQLHRH